MRVDYEDLGKVAIPIGVSALLFALRKKAEGVDVSLPMDWPDVPGLEVTGEAIRQAASVSLSVAALSLVGAGALSWWHAQQRLRYVRIIPHEHTVTNKEKVENLVQSLWRSKRGTIRKMIKGKDWYQLLFVSTKGDHPDGEIHIYLGFPADQTGYVLQEVKNTYPNAEIQFVKPEDIPIPEKGEGGTFRPVKRRSAGLPLQAFEKERIGEVLSHLKGESVLAVTFHPTRFRLLKKQVKRTRKAILNQAKKWMPKLDGKKKVDESKLDPDVKEKLDALKARGKFTGTFQVQVHLWGQNAANVAKSIKNVMEKDGMLAFRKKRTCPIRLHPYPMRSMVWTEKELANLLHLPSGKTKQEARQAHIFDRIPHVLSGQDLLQPGQLTKGLTIGRLLHPALKDRPVRLLEEKLRTHALILGKTGAGKTSVLLEMIRKDLLPRFLSGKPFGGFTFIDPKGEAVKTILTYIRKAKIEGKRVDMSKIHYFDVSSPDFSLGLNLLERHPGQTKEEVIKNAMEVMGNAFGDDSMWFKKYGRLVLKALLADKKMQHTILAIPEFVAEDSPLRRRIKMQLAQGTIEEQELYRELEREEENFGSNKMDPLINRLTDLKDNPITKRIFGQRKTSLEVLKYMQDGHIVLFNVDGLSKAETKLVMGYIVTLYHQFVWKRTNQQMNHYLVIDEAHEVQLPVLYEAVLPKDRAAGLCAILMTQYLDQFKRELKDAIKELSGTIISYRVGPDTARALEDMTNHRFRAENIKDLKNLRAAVLTEDEKGHAVNFFVETEPPYIFDREGKPTYYGEDKLRASDEKHAAFSEALEEIGVPLMARDTLTAHDARKEIQEYLVSLWELTPEEKRARLETATANAVRESEGKKPKKAKLVTPTNGAARVNPADIGEKLAEKLNGLSEHH